ncbi:interleukin-15 receptor subunit alpha isoform X3 [Hippoglossus stenolepis]|uniref:interleukin-15 receptor subunit alpha isoform X3 n=1 Tax=Hippoglossus stenolepis TaxID=195615 RepID=UPI001FAEF057|nr:interleukin-15 receptor subunit alpha isoform X3 [Hippoglossus stenolepis]
MSSGRRHVAAAEEWRVESESDGGVEVLLSLRMVCTGVSLPAGHDAVRDKSSCSCSEIPVLPLTDPPPENCSRNTFRYTCIDGYLRKAGTSNLIKCSGSNSAAKWTTATLRCIPDPRRTTTRPPKSPVTTASFTNLQMTKSGSFSSTGLLEKNSLEPTSLSVQVDHSQDKSSCSCSEIPVLPLTDPPPETCSRDSFRYTCIDGYLRKAGTSNLIKCSGSNSAAKWNKPTLRCIPDPLRTTTRPPKSPVTTASFTNLQMTKSGSFSSKGLLEKNSLEPTSLGVQVDHSQDKSSCSCSEIPVLPLTDPPPETCSRDSFRYTCIDGYLRKAGTSNLIKCSGSNSAAKWNKPTLRCIPDPLRTTTRPPKSPVTTSFTNLQMTKSGSFSSTGLLEKNSLEPTSLGVQVDHSQATDRTTPASSNQPPNNRTDSPPLSGHTDHRLGTTTTALIVCASLVIVCALIGISYVCYRRKSQRNDRPATDEEKIPMNNVPAEPAS